jgi:hypothetical protein
MTCEVPMTCEDPEEEGGRGVAAKAARLTLAILSSTPIRMVARRLPKGMRRALATVFLTAVDVLRS